MAAAIGARPYTDTSNASCGEQPVVVNVECDGGSGAKGDKGDKGDAGVGIDTITVTTEQTAQGN